MAFLRLLSSPLSIDGVCLSSRQFLSLPTSLSSLHRAPQHTTTLSLSSLSRSVPFLLFGQSIKHQKFSLCYLSTAPTRCYDQTAELQPSETVDDDDQEQAQNNEQELSKTRLLAQNIPWSATAEDMRLLFEKYGSVVDVELSMYNKTRNRGLAFVTMGSEEEAQAAFKNLESYEYEGRVIKLAWAYPKKQKTASPPQEPKPLPIHNLFVANLPFQARAKDLKEFFDSDKGNVVSAEIIFHDNPRRSAGYGFVTFNSKLEAEAALAAFQGKEFMGRQIRVARSRRFLREGTKSAVQTENVAKELAPA